LPRNVGAMAAGRRSDRPFSIRESDRCLETIASRARPMLDRPFSIRESDRCLETSIALAKRGDDGSFSIRESDRCLETTNRRIKRAYVCRLSVSASRIVASKQRHAAAHADAIRDFQYPRVGSLPRNASGSGSPCGPCGLSVSASRIVASKLVDDAPYLDDAPLSVSASRIVASKLFGVSKRCGRAPTFSIRESDRCLETSFRLAPPSSNTAFSIRESDRCLETR